MGLLCLTGLGIYSCDNNSSVTPPESESIFSAARLGTSASDTTTCRVPLTKVDIATLPASITTYIAANYAGATILEAGRDSRGIFVVRISANNQSNVLAFNADGTFKADLKFRGKGPGRGEGKRDSLRRDSLHHPKPHPDSLGHPKPGKKPRK